MLLYATRHDPQSSSPFQSVSSGSWLSRCVYAHGRCNCDSLFGRPGKTCLARPSSLSRQTRKAPPANRGSRHNRRIIKTVVAVLPHYMLCSFDAGTRPGCLSFPASSDFGRGASVHTAGARWPLRRLSSSPLHHTLERRCRPRHACRYRQLRCPKATREPYPIARPYRRGMEEPPMRALVLILHHLRHLRPTSSSHSGGPLQQMPRLKTRL